MNKSNLANTNWWWKYHWREGWMPDSMTRFGWDVSIQSIQDEDESKQMAWFINLLMQSLGLFITLLHQVVIFALKSPRVNC